jgi:CRISPR-associated endonuclease Cas2
MFSGYGKWTQYSVFECFLTTVQFAKLQIKVETLIKPNEDSVRVYVLDAGALKRTITYIWLLSTSTRAGNSFMIDLSHLFLANQSGGENARGFAKTRTLINQYF